VNVDVSGGGGTGIDLANAYSSMSALEGAEDDLGNLVTRDEWLDARMYATGGTSDTTKCTWAGWTLDSTRYIRVWCPELTTQTAWDTSIYKLVVNNDDAIVIQATYILFYGIQASITNGDNTSDNIFDGSYVSGTSVVYLDRCYAKAGTNSVCTGFSFADTEQTFYIRSCISESQSTGRGHYHVGNTGYIYQCTHRGGANGFRSGTSGTYTVTNDIFFDTTDDFLIGAGSTVTVLDCASDDGDGTNPIAPTGGNWAGEFTDYTNGDFTPKATGNIYHAGTDLDIAEDYRGTAFHSSTPTIGAFEYVASGISGTSAISFTRNTIAGSGKESFRASSGFSMILFNISTSGSELFGGQSAISLENSTLTGSGKESFKAESEVALQQGSISGTGAESFRGTSSVASENIVITTNGGISGGTVAGTSVVIMSHIATTGSGTVAGLFIDETEYTSMISLETSYTSTIDITDDYTSEIDLTTDYISKMKA
jgi:hypothetical protein